MQAITEIGLQKAVQGVFTRQEAACWVNSDDASLDALLKRAVAAKEVLRLRRGLFCLASRYMHSRIHEFELAQRIHGPSYISLESALAHYGWIPEAVYAVTSASIERSRTFETPMGLFSFTRIPQREFFAGVRRRSLEGRGSFFLASPLKALADYVYAHSCDLDSADSIVASLRIEETELKTLTVEEFDRLAPVYRSGRVCRFLKGLRKDLRL